MFFASKLWKKFPTQRHAQHIMSLHYLVKHEYPKIDNIV